MTQYHPHLIPSYIQQLRPYKAGKGPADLVREYGLSPNQVSKLASNENPLGPSPLAQKVLAQSWPLHRYPDMMAHQLREKLARFHQLDLDNIVVGNGSEGIMAYIMRTFLRPGDHVVTSEATFIGFTILAKGVGANLQLVPLTEQGKFDVEGILSAVTEKTKIVYVANPNNPTGTYLKKGEFRRLASGLPATTLLVMDEAYFEYTQHLPDYPDSLVLRQDNCLTLRTFSKAYGLAGARLGVGLGNPYLIENITKVKLPFEPSLLAQSLGVAALEDHHHIEKTVKNNAFHLAQLTDFFTTQGLDFFPSAANFLCVDVKSEEVANQIFDNLLREGVIVRPLKSNGLPNHLRISVGTEGEMQHFYRAWEKVY